MERFNHLEKEPKWQKLWLKSKVYEPDFKAAKRPFYNLMMFPYPSAEGLHVGNMYAFVGSDIYGRFKRMQGYDVFEPIGLDGFGIHSENFALKIGAHPMKQAKVSEKRFYNQLAMLGNGFAWQERLETYDPEYYKWTQWIFTQLFKNGLAYRKKAEVNWCPSCMTVLADEQVVAGECERCGSKVVKKDLEQWFFKITTYADKLLKNLGRIDWSEKVKIAQRNWIGKSEGSLLKFTIFNSQFSIDVFTTRADTLYGATYMVLAPEHSLIKSLKSQITNYREVEEYIRKSKSKSPDDRARSKTGVRLKGVRAINPSSKATISVWVSDYVVMAYGTGAIMAVPAHDERDFEFAKRFGLSLIEVIHADESKYPREAFTGEGKLINSDQFNGLDSETARKEITRFVKGKWKAQYRLRDWLISRQRYWGPPIPMIFCDTCRKASRGERKDMPGWYTVPEKDLPVTLPFVEDFRPTGTGKSPLASVESFYKVICPRCRKWARRETDVSDTFLDSAWYYLGYLILGDKKSTFVPSSGRGKIKNQRFSWNKTTVKKWLPVDMYIGGAEHSVLHLLYSRFLTMAFKDFKLIDFEEPFQKFRAHGLIIKDGAKMSKSKGNIVNPDDYISKYGADTLRMYLMFTGPFMEGGDFRDEGVVGITRFLGRVTKLSERVRNYNDTLSSPRLLHQTIKKVTDDVESLHYNTAISALMILANDFESKEVLSVSEYAMFLMLLAPFAPYLSEELWSLLFADQKSMIYSSKSESGPTSYPQTFSKKNSIHLQPWPKYDSKLIEDDMFILVIQVNGKVRGKVRALKIITETEAIDLAQKQISLLSYLKDKEPKKVIFVPGRLINFVVT